MKTKILASLMGVLFVSMAWAGQGSQGNPGVIPPQAHYRGMTYAEWSVAWWQWLLAIPTDAPQFPFGPQNGDECGNGANAGKVWFLVGFFGDIKKEVSCTVPVGTALFFPIYNTECSIIEPDPFHLDLDNPTDCVDTFFNGNVTTIQDLTLTIDGKAIDLREAYLITSDVFDFLLPDPPTDQNFLGVAGDACTQNADDCQAVSKGYWVMVPPLSKGQHTISFFANRENPDGTLRAPVNTEYLLTVVKKP